MPIYEYFCPSCENGYERRKPMKDSETDVCDCGGVALKTISAFSTPGLSKKSGMGIPDCPGCGNPLTPEYHGVVGFGIRVGRDDFSEN